MGSSRSNTIQAFPTEGLRPQQSALGRSAAPVCVLQRKLLAAIPSTAGARSEMWMMSF